MLEFEGPVHYIMDQYHMIKYSKDNDRAKEILDGFCPFIDLNEKHHRNEAVQSDSESKHQTIAEYIDDTRALNDYFERLETLRRM